jgi:hypothetical protein
VEPPEELLQVSAREMESGKPVRNIEVVVVVVEQVRCRAVMDPSNIKRSQSEGPGLRQQCSENRM